MATRLFESQCQFVGKGLRPAARIVVAQEIRESQHRIEHERSPRWRRTPVSTICGEQEFEFLVAEVLSQRLSHRHSAVMLQPIRLPPTEVTQKSVHVEFADNREELVQRARFFWKLQLEAGEVDVEILRTGKPRAIGKMNMGHRNRMSTAVLNHH